jgi:hypothetical protein
MRFRIYFLLIIVLIVIHSLGCYSTTASVRGSKRLRTGVTIDGRHNYRGLVAAAQVAKAGYNGQSPNSETDMLNKIKERYLMDSAKDETDELLNSWTEEAKRRLQGSVSMSHSMSMSMSVSMSMSMSMDISMSMSISGSRNPAEASPSHNQHPAEVDYNIPGSNQDPSAEKMQCLWHFLAGSLCTSHIDGDVVGDQIVYDYVISDGNCHYNTILGYYRASCQPQTTDATGQQILSPAKFILRDVFCTDATCNSCHDDSMIQPAQYLSQNCNFVQFPGSDRNVEFDFAYEFIGGCFEDEACSVATYNFD